MISQTPLRYPGGKGRFTNYIAELLELNGVVDGHYVEPFAGGAGVAFSLLFSEQVKHIHINDIDENIYAFWYSALYHTEDLCRLIQDTPVSIEVWLRQRDVKKYPEDHSLLKRGFATFFLNRTNRSGILNAGVIGGLKQAGKWKLDARYNKEDLIARVKKVGMFSQRVSLHSMDACEYIRTVLSEVKADALVYLDPPYYVKGGELYQNSFDHKEHERLAAQVKKIPSNLKWIVSYDNVDEIKKMYADFQQEEFTLNYSARTHCKGSEVLIFKDGLIRPEEVYTTKKKRNKVS